MSYLHIRDYINSSASNAESHRGHHVEAQITLNVTSGKIDSNKRSINSTRVRYMKSSDEKATQMRSSQRREVTT